MRRPRILLAALTGCVIGSTPLQAQGSDPGAFESRFSVSAVAGGLRLDDDGLGFSFEPDGERYEGRSDIASLVGAAVAFDVVPAFSLEAHYARAWTAIEGNAFLGDDRLPDPVLEEDRVAVQLWGIRGRVKVPSGGPIRASGVLGYGTMEVDLDFHARLNGERFGPSGSTARERMWEIGGGVEWQTREHWGIRADVIDHVQMCSGETHSEVNVCGRDGDIDRLHHVGISGAVVLRP
jgi:hypothetical protein